MRPPCPNESSAPIWLPSFYGAVTGNAALSAVVVRPAGSEATIQIL